MKFLNSRTAMIVAGVAAGGAVIYLLSRRASKAASDAADSIATGLNPTSPNNIVNRGVNAVGDSLTGGSGSWSLGSSIYDLFNPTYDPNADSKPDLRPIDYAELPRRRGEVTSPTSHHDSLAP